MKSLFLFIRGKYWVGAPTSNQQARELADRHYSRKSPGTPRFTPPGKALILVGPDRVWAAVKNLYRADGLTEGIHCTLFRNESNILSSELIKEAVKLSRDYFGTLPIYTFVDRKKIRSTNPGCCFKKAGFKNIGTTKDRDLDILCFEVSDKAEAAWQ